MTEKFLLDSNVFIQAKNSYYAFEVCPGFWDSILGHYKTGAILSIDFVRQEILRGKDDLADWVIGHVPNEFFLSAGDESVQREYRRIIGWVQSNPHYSNEAKADFAAAADGWLIAHALAYEMVVVTHEQPSSGKAKVKIPNVCDEFDVKYRDTFSMLKTLKVKFDWNH